MDVKLRKRIVKCMHGVERGTPWSGDLDDDAKSPEELGSV